MFQQLEPKRIRYYKKSRKMLEVPIVEDSSYLTCTMLVKFAMVAHLATNHGRNWWNEPKEFTNYDVVKGDVWLHVLVFRDQKYA